MPTFPYHPDADHESPMHGMLNIVNSQQHHNHSWLSEFCCTYLTVVDKFLMISTGTFPDVFVDIMVVRLIQKNVLVEGLLYLFCYFFCLLVFVIVIVIVHLCFNK